MQRMAHYLDRPIPGKRVNYTAKRFSIASIQRSSAGRCPKGYDNPNGGTVVGSMNLWTTACNFRLTSPLSFFEAERRFSHSIATSLIQVDVPFLFILLFPSYTAASFLGNFRATRIVREFMENCWARKNARSELSVRIYYEILPAQRSSQRTMYPFVRKSWSGKGLGERCLVFVPMLTRGSPHCIYLLETPCAWNLPVDYMHLGCFLGVRNSLRAYLKLSIAVSNIRQNVRDFSRPWFRIVRGSTAFGEFPEQNTRLLTNYFTRGTNHRRSAHRTLRHALIS